MTGRLEKRIQLDDIIGACHFSVVIILHLTWFPVGIHRWFLSYMLQYYLACER